MSMCVALIALLIDAASEIDENNAEFNNDN
jgi:hypothetical protein